MRNGRCAAGDAAFVSQFRADIAFGKAFNLVAAVASLRFEELLTPRNGLHLRLVRDILHRLCRQRLLGRQIGLRLIRRHVLPVQQFDDALGGQRLLVADGERARVIRRMALSAGGFHVFGLQKRVLRMLRVAVGAILNQFPARAVMAGGAAECRERMLLEVDFLVLVIGLVVIGQTGLGRDAVGELRAVNDAQIMRVVFGLHADAWMRAQMS